MHRRDGAVDYYFVANVSAQAQAVRVAFAVGHRTPERWDPETGEAQSPIVHEHTTSAGRRVTEVELRLQPFESCFVTFRPGSTPPAVRATDPRGRWRLSRDAGDMLGASADNIFMVKMNYWLNP